MELLIFELAGQRYGLAVDDVREVVHAVSISPLPKAPAVVEGVINVRGTVTAVLDIRRRFGHPAKPLAPSDHFVLARAGERQRPSSPTRFTRKMRGRGPPSRAHPYVIFELRRLDDDDHPEACPTADEPCRDHGDRVVRPQPSPPLCPIGISICTRSGIVPAMTHLFPPF